MKNYPNKFKYILFSLIIVASFVMSKSAHADTMQPYFCPEGGAIISYVNMSPTGPFAAKNPTTFGVDAYVTSSCNMSHRVQVIARNYYDYNGQQTLIPDQNIDPGSAIPLAYARFASSNVVGAYFVNWDLGVWVQPPGPGILHVGPVVRSSHDVNNVWTQFLNQQDYYNQFGYPYPGYPGGRLIVKINNVTVCDTDTDGPSGSVNNSACGSTFFNLSAGDVVSFTVDTSGYPGAHWIIKNFQVTKGTGGYAYDYNFDQTWLQSQNITGSCNARDIDSFCQTQTFTVTAGSDNGYQVNVEVGMHY